MAHSSWRDEYGLASFPNLYRPAFLRYLFGRLKGRDHLVAAYRGEEIVSFLASVPHTFNFRGRICRGVWSGLLVTKKELLRQGLAMATIQEGLKLNEQSKYDFILATFEVGHRSTLLMKRFQAAGHRLEFMKRLNVLARILDLPRVNASEGLKRWERTAVMAVGGSRKPKKGGEEAVREYRPEDLEDCLSIINGYQGKIDLARVWEAEELAWELAFPDVSQTLVYEKDGRVNGFINFIYHDHLGKTKERWGWVNHVAYSNLSGGERIAFINAFLRYLKEQDCVGIIEWTKKYYPQGPLYRAHFFPYFRAVNMYSWTLNPEISLKNVRRCNEILV
jgi:hypothetical protein